MLIGNNISFYPSVSCLYRLSSHDKFDCTSTPPISVCQTIHLSACPSILPWLCWQFHQPLISVRLSVCPAVCPALAVLTAPRVSCRRSVLLRHGHWSDTCTLSADGQATILSHTFCSNFLTPQKFIFPVPSLAAALSLSFSVICLHLHPPSPSWPSCCWEAGRKTDWERQTDRKHTIPWRVLLRKSASQAQSIFSLLSMSPMLRLHLDSISCNDVPLEMEKPQTTSSQLLNTSETHRIRQR